jgi:hypothetical protein
LDHGDDGDDDDEEEEEEEEEEDDEDAGDDDDDSNVTVPVIRWPSGARWLGRRLSSATSACSSWRPQEA